MRVLVLGGGGPIGQATVRRLGAGGDEVIWASRQAPSPASEPGHATADRSRPAEIASLIRDQRIDAVVDMVAYTLEQTAPLLTALDGRIGRYVLVSSCDVYRNYGLLQRLETGEPDLGDLDEAAPLRTSRHPYRGAQQRADHASDRWMDDYDKIPVEAATQGLACDWTTLRLPMVYGPADRQRRFRWATAPMLAGAPVLQAPAAWLAWETTYGFVENVGEAIALATRHPAAAQATFNVADEPAMSHRAWAERFAAAIGWRGEIQPVDQPDHPFARAVAGLDLTVPLKASARRLFDELGYRPPVDPATAATLTLTA